MKHFEVRVEGERLVLRKTRAPLVGDSVVFGSLCTTLSWGAWKSWAMSMGWLPYFLTLLALGTGAGAARMWRQLERSMAEDDRWIFDRAVDKVEHKGEYLCALSDVAQVRLDEEWRVEAHSLLLLTRGGATITIEKQALPTDEMKEAARAIAEFARAELIVVRHD